MFTGFEGILSNNGSSAVIDNGAGSIGIPGAVTTTGSLTLVKLSAPSTPIVTPTGGASSTWSYKIVAKSGSFLRTDASSAGSTATGAATLDASHFNTISWTAVANSTGYDIYRTAVGTSPATTGKIGSAAAGVTSFVDNGLAGDGTTAPTINSTGGIVLPTGTFNATDVTIGAQPIASGISNGLIGSGICFDSGGNMWFLNPGHEPSTFFGTSIVNKWSQHLGWSPNGTFPNAGMGVSMAGSITEGFDTTPGMLVVGWNASVNTTASYVGARGFATQLTATAGLTAGQVVKIDTANDNSCVVAATTDTAAGIPIGICINSPSAAGNAYVLTQGITTLPLLGTGTINRGDYIIVDTTTAGRVKGTATYTAGTVIGKALTSQSVVGSAVTIMVGLR